MSLPLPVDDNPADVLPDLAPFGRPRLRDDVPIMWRSETSIQLGDDVVVERVTRSHVAWLTSLDGLHAPATIVDSLTIPDHEARRLVRALLAANALEDAARIPDALRWASQPERDIAGRRFGAALRTYRDRERAFAAMAGREGCRIAVVGAGPVAGEATAALGSSGLVCTDVHPTFAILADGPHPDIPAHFDHALQDIPHLHVGVLGERAIVGPLVVPGATSCLRCAHLHRRDADAAWPLIAVQWAHALAGMAVPPVDPILCRLAATHAALLVRSWADVPHDPGTWSGFAVELRLPHGEARRVDRPVHPLCGCQWSRT
jgi:bacteriocin biosynthesis cyclodehydratase domain-containing protein